MILSCVVLTQYISVTDRRTEDASAVAKTRYSMSKKFISNHVHQYCWKIIRQPT